MNILMGVAFGVVVAIVIGIAAPHLDPSAWKWWALTLTLNTAHVVLR